MQHSGRGNSPVSSGEESPGTQAAEPVGNVLAEMPRQVRRRIKRSYSPGGRGTTTNPPNRFETISVQKASEDLAPYFEDPEQGRPAITTFYHDRSRSVLAKNNSPDVGVTFSLNPYRGCEHGCVYCYARPTHEYLGFSSGLDFETKIMVKPDAPALLDRQFRSRSWKPQVVMLSGDTDCYQPIERKLEITRRCLEVFLRYRSPVLIVTKNALIQRDLDILKELAALNLVLVTVSITSLNADLIRTMEPRTSAPTKRLETIEVLAHAGIPVGVSACPIIPALNDEEIPAILREAAARGASYAGYTIVRLPHAVKDLFVDWLKRELPDRARAILNRIRSVRSGGLTCSDFGKRMKGDGQVAQTIEQLFQSSCRRYRLNATKVALSTDRFRSGLAVQGEIF